MAFNPFERLVALRYLRARRKEGFISVIAGFSLAGISLGVATLIIVMAVMNGFRQELLTRILGVGGHVTVYGAPGPLTNYADVTHRLKALPGVVDAAPLVSGQAMITVGRRAGGVAVQGITRDDLVRRPIIAGNIKVGSLDQFGAPDSVLIGTRLATRFGLTVGDKLTLVAPSGNVTAFGTLPRAKGYRIVGLFEIGMYEYDSNFVYMPLAAAQTFFREGDRASAIEVMLADPDGLRAAVSQITSALGPGTRLRHWQDVNSSFFTAIQVERNVMFLILTLIILVAAFNVISGMIMLVKDKGRDIAILRTMGATRGAVMRIFLLAGASVGVVGTFIGFLLGVAFAANIETIRGWISALTGTDLFSAEIYFLSQLPAKIDAGEVATVVGMSLSLSFLATLYPSWRAARLDPVEALRYE
ncbi:MAG: lipoprotein-releasing ABC transporter permease subunit [Alphaproteobacteria bacterium]|jgi:lipoprotein-releasing system permease protein|nr:lipoprotein-releasing ABC transporter permease subunit [Alphaproteobacteria bacterium]